MDTVPSALETETIGHGYEPTQGLLHARKA